MPNENSAIPSHSIVDDAIWQDLAELQDESHYRNRYVRGYLDQAPGLHPELRQSYHELRERLVQHTAACHAAVDSAEIRIAHQEFVAVYTAGISWMARDLQTYNFNTNPNRMSNEEYVQRYLTDNSVPAATADSAISSMAASVRDLVSGASTDAAASIHDNNKGPSA